MRLVKITFYDRGFEEIRRSPKTARVIEGLARSMASKAGAGYAWAAQQGEKGPAPVWNKKRSKGFQGRYRGIVFPETFRAYRDNAKNNTLVKLAGGAGGF